MKRLVVLLTGGSSEEREVSLNSCTAINRALQNLGYNVHLVDPQGFSSWSEFGAYLVKMDPYIVFNGLHGGVGENGVLQAYLSLLGLNFTGSGFKASALSMDKILSFKLVNGLGVKVADYTVLEAIPQLNIRSIVSKYGFPLVVKPNESGSSYGISIVKNEDMLQKAIFNAFQYSDRIIIQKFIDGSELTVSILGNKALPVVEIKTKEGWYDYTHKYTQGKTDYLIPAQISEATTESLKEKSEFIFKQFDCKGYARIDYRFDGEDYYFLELNTLPGMTSLSLTPMAAEKIGISFEDLIGKIIDYSLS